MEDEIQEKLEEIYALKIDVKFKDFRMYDVYVRVDTEKEFMIPYLYDARSTLEYNITVLRGRIDSEIVDLFRKKVDLNDRNENKNKRSRRETN